MHFSNAKFFAAKGARRPFVSDAHGPFSLSEAIVASYLAQLVQGRVVTEGDSRCLEEARPGTVGDALVLLCKRHVYREALVALISQDAVHRLRIDRIRVGLLNGGVLLHDDSRNIPSMMATFQQGKEVLVFVNKSAEARHMSYGGSVDFNFAAASVAKILKFVTWQLEQALDRVRVLAEDLDEVLGLLSAGAEAASLKQPFIPGLPAFDPTRDVGAFLAVHGFSVAPAKDGCGWHVMDVAMCSRGGGTSWCEYTPVLVRTQAEAARFVTARGDI